MLVPPPIVGIIANPVSARDIRRVVSYAGSMQVTDRANIVLRVLAGLATAGIEKVVMMPENVGIRVHLLRAMRRAANQGDDRFPQLDFLDMPVTGEAADSSKAASMMLKMEVAAIVVLGGDGTHRVVAQECGNTPIASVSTGTNNAFPEMREPTITGLAVGLAVRGKVPPSVAFLFNKRLDIQVNDHHEIALVDVAIVREQFVGARAVWRADTLQELFVTFAEPGGIGMSSIAGLIAPVTRGDPLGRHVIFGPLGEAAQTLTAPLAPGLMEQIGINRVDTLNYNQPVTIESKAGSIALDGEREITFTKDDHVSVTLREAAFQTIDIACCMAHAAAEGLFVETTNPTLNSKPDQGEDHDRQSILAT